MTANMTGTPTYAPDVPREVIVVPRELLERCRNLACTAACSNPGTEWFDIYRHLADDLAALLGVTP